MWYVLSVGVSPTSLCVCTHCYSYVVYYVCTQMCLVPASAHGTNAASAEMAGLETVQLKTNNIGGIDMDLFKKEVLYTYR